MYSPPPGCSAKIGQLLMLLDLIRQRRPDTREGLKLARTESVDHIAEQLHLRSFHTVAAKFLKKEGLGLKTAEFDDYVWAWLTSGDKRLRDVMSKHVASSSEQVDLQAITDFFGNVALPLDETLQRKLVSPPSSEVRFAETLAPLQQSGVDSAVVFEPNDSDDTKQSVRPKYTLTQCATDSGFSEEELARWIRAIERKGQAIIYGPPGTGKTYIAEKLALHLIGGGLGFYDLIQFHPAYAYEDFIQGIRPHAGTDGHLDYPMMPGRFLEFCEKAKNCEGRSVLIIDEINRADLARVFGELMYLLEYRDAQIPLSSGGVLRIPPNVRLIGTMNTADRSIAMVDHALRRRFAFLELRPDFEVLMRFHQRKGTELPVERLVQTLKRLNSAINDRHFEVGITFFLRDDLAAQIEDIWQMEIEPYLEEYFFDQPEKAENFRWERVCLDIMS